MSILNEVKRIFGVNGKSIEEALSNVPEGGAGGGVFIVTSSTEGEVITLNKTWQEIHDAISSGKIGVVRSAMTESETPTMYNDSLISAIFYSSLSEIYEVITYENGTQFAFETATADGYPSYGESSEGGEGTEPA